MGAASTVSVNAGALSVASFDVPDLMLPTIGRKTLAPIAVHQDCVAPGVALREIRPPLTELMPEGYPAQPMARLAAPPKGAPLREALLHTPPARDFPREAIARDAFRTINRLAFAGGSYFPLFPAGVHVALVRPFWVIHNVSGMEPGIWSYRALHDDWCLLRSHGFRLEAQYLACEDEAFGNAAAVCFIVANLVALMTQGGPVVSSGPLRSRDRCAAHPPGGARLPTRRQTRGRLLR